MFGNLFFARGGHAARRNWMRHSRLMLALSAGGLMLASAARADFVNGNFDATPAFDGWTHAGHTIPKVIPTFPPLTLSDLGLSSAEVPANDKSAVLSAGNDVTTGGQLTWSDPVARVHTSDKGSGRGNKASSISQQITIAAGDVDVDGKVHIRFTAAPVLDEPGHPEEEQPYFFIEITKADGTSLFSTFNFANQAGIPWKKEGDVTFTDWQAFDIALDPAQVAVGDQVKLTVIAAGCGQSGHTGAVYLNNIRTTNTVSGASLWVTAEGPDAVRKHTNPDGSTDVTYTYTYRNDGSTTVDNVTVTPSMPQTTETTPVDTSLVSIGNPSTSGASCNGTAGSTGAASCTIGRLAPGESGTFTMTVRVPAGTAADSLNNGSYPIAGTAVPPLLGPLVKTALLADMVPDLGNLPATGLIGQSYSGSYSCTNQGSTSALSPTCDVSGLPQGVAVGQCKLNVSGVVSNWSAGTAVPPAGTVTCPVSGTITAPSGLVPEVTTGAGNDGDTTNDQTSKNVDVGGPDMKIDLSGLPKTVALNKPYAGSFTCTNVGVLDAVAGTVCSVSGLPAGVTPGQCTSGSPAKAWSAGDPVAAGVVVTCEVSGTITSESPATVQGVAGVTNDVDPSNNVATQALSPVPTAPNLVVDLSGLPGTATVGKGYTGSFTCSNTGDADATGSTSCLATGLPPGVTQGACKVSPAGAAWVPGDVIAQAAVVTCEVSGTPTQEGVTTAVGTTGAVTATKDVTVGAAVTPPAPGSATPVPTLSQWGQALMAVLMAVAAVFTLRRRMR